MLYSYILIYNDEIDLNTSLQDTDRWESILSTELIKVPVAANWKGVCLQNTSKPHSCHLNIW